jgi:hypothetical protein
MQTLKQALNVHLRANYDDLTETQALGVVSVILDKTYTEENQEQAIIDLIARCFEIDRHPLGSDKWAD